MTPERARELLAYIGRGPITAHLTQAEQDWVAQQIPWNAPLDRTVADLIRETAVSDTQSAQLSEAA
jgi:hypothetical protein